MENSSTSFVPNNKLRVLFGFEPPDSSVDCRDFPHLSDPTFGCPFPGSTLEIVSMLAAFLKWEIIPSVDIPSAIGSLDYGGLQPDGSYSGMMGYITRNEVDTICTLTQYEINDKDTPFELSYPVYNVNLIYLARNVPPIWQDYLLKALVPYSTVVWVVILASLIAQVIFGVFVRKVEINMKLEIDFSPFKTLWHYVAYQTNQPVDDIFVYYKTSAALLKAPNMDPFHSSEEMFDLIASGRYTYVIDAINYYSDWYKSTWNNTDLEHIRLLNEALKSNPALITNTTEEAFAYLQQGGYIVPSQDDTYEMYITQSLCDIYRFSADTPQKSSMFIFLKNATLLKEWNRAIIMNQDFIQRTFYKYYRSGFITGGAYPNCSVDPKENLPDSMKPLGV
uniref:Solute-binding protein family 3/N-terminal domain-containing protein n=1 Tax=Acrobeloides nanus TaxID=290746 RepID=A0A914ECC9_9BILA